MKMVDRILRVILIILVISSFVFSYFIWTNSTNRSILRNAENNKIEKIAERDPLEVFMPTKLFWHKNNEILYTNRETAILNIQKEMLVWHFGNVEEVSFDNETGFDNIMEKWEAIELTYPEEISIGEFWRVNRLNITLNDNVKDQLFNRLYVCLDTNTLYFLDVSTKKAFTGSFSGDVNLVKKVLTDAETKYVPVYQQGEGIPYLYYLPEMHLEKYSYIIATLPNNGYVSSLFQNSSEVIGNELVSDQIAYSTQNERLRISKRSDSEFEGALPEEFLEDYGDNPFAKSYYYVGKIANYYGKLRYFDKYEDKYFYRQYVEGFPIFDDKMQAEITSEIKSQTEVDLHFWTSAIQVPLPSEEVILLESTETTVKRILEAGYDISAIEDLQIGYSWSQVEGSEQVVDLRPSWYVKLSGDDYIWKDVREITGIEGQR